MMLRGHFINVIPGPDLLRHPHLPGVCNTNQVALRLVLWRFLPAAEQMPECRHGILEENAAAVQKYGGGGWIVSREAVTNSGSRSHSGKS